MVRACRTAELPPHVYSKAQSAYQCMLSTGRDQSIVLTGQSNSGKTTTLKHLLEYYAFAYGGLHSNSIGGFSLLCLLCHNRWIISEVLVITIMPIWQSLWLKIGYIHFVGKVVLCEYKVMVLPRAQKSWVRVPLVQSCNRCLFVPMAPSDELVSRM